MNIESFKELVEKVYAYHTKRAPGIPIGCAMVLLAQEKLGECKKIGAISETQVCLSDAIQYLTGCTIGNKYLKLKDQIGRYAMTLYSRKDGHGVRVFVDQKKINKETMPEIWKFFQRKRGPEVRDNQELRQASAKKIVEEFYAGNMDIFGYEQVQVADFEKDPVAPAICCKECGETFLSKSDGETVCLVCSGAEAYYTK
jgi:formylmethanofuran dehydrogenase subunit E